jgi:hypothetical protein
MYFLLSFHRFSSVHSPESTQLQVFQQDVAPMSASCPCLSPSFCSVVEILLLPLSKARPSLLWYLLYCIFIWGYWVRQGEPGVLAPFLSGFSRLSRGRRAGRRWVVGADCLFSPALRTALDAHDARRTDVSQGDGDHPESGKGAVYKASEDEEGEPSGPLP